MDRQTYKPGNYDGDFLHPCGVPTKTGPCILEGGHMGPHSTTKKVEGKKKRKKGKR